MVWCVLWSRKGQLHVLPRSKTYRGTVDSFRLSREFRKGELLKWVNNFHGVLHKIHVAVCNFTFHLQIIIITYIKGRVKMAYRNLLSPVDRLGSYSLGMQCHALWGIQ